MTELVKYDEACRALAEAAAVDEVQNIRSQAEAMRAYARQAKDRDLEIAAAHIRFRAERRLGELIIAQRETVGLNTGSRGQLKGRNPSGSAVSEQPEDSRPTLEQAGIDRKLSSRAQRMAEIAPDKFEALLARHRDEVFEGNNKVSVDLMRTSAEQDGREKRRQLAEALSDASAALPTGRKFPVIYADPAWHRKQGVTNRSYENHYSTMSWDDICAMPVKDMVLPDAWLFLWIPRAHMFALHPVDTECFTPDGEVVNAKIKMPLAWAVAKSWGFDSYSTAFIWTKTDDEHPADHGGGVIVFDQDEVLLLFKRGRGLPKPATDEKFGSNHRERSKPLGHSRKPEFYRDMIATMAGGVPVLELFARVDAEHPLPADWEGWGNQAQIDSHANADDEATAGQTCNAAAESVSRLVPGRTGTATSETMDATAGETAINSPAMASEKVGGVAGACSALSCGENRTRTEIETSGDGVERHAPPAGADTGTSEGRIANDFETESARRVQGDPEQQSLTAGETATNFDNASAAGVSRETNSDAEYRAEYDALLALDTGEHVDEPMLDALRAKKLIVGKAKAKLTKEGRRALEQHRAHFDWLAKLDVLPTNLRQLTGIYGNHLWRLNEAVLAADEVRFKNEREMLDLIEERANGDTSFGAAVNDAPEHVRGENAAPFGQEPMWYQRGVFRLAIDGVPYLVTQDEHAHFAAYAEDPDKPFASETGFRSFLGYGFQFGRTVAQHAEAVIRDHIVNEDVGGRRKPRKKPLSLPACVYRMPVQGEDRRPVRVSGSLFDDEPASSGDDDAATPDVAPQPQPDLFAIEQPVSEVVDGIVQTRIPLDDDEIELRDVLAIYALHMVPIKLPDARRRELERDLIGRGWLEVREDGTPLRVTAEGHAWLVTLVNPISHTSQGEAAHEAV